MTWAGHAYMSLVEETEVKRPLGRPRHKWENTTKMDLMLYPTPGITGWQGQRSLRRLVGVF
jgi:hypothetical protein